MDPLTLDRDTRRSRALLVVNWSVDPGRVIAICRALAQERPTEFGIVVPARLNGLDWIGDPFASVPCAQQQLERIRELGESANLRTAAVGVGDPDALTAIGDALAGWPAQEIIVARTRSRAIRALSLTRRAERSTGLPVRCFSVPKASRRGFLLRMRDGHCELEQPQSA